jgi:hypothetical protein
MTRKHPSHTVAMTGHYTDRTCQWRHLSRPSPEPLAALGDGWLPSPGRAARRSLIGFSLSVLWWPPFCEKRARSLGRSGLVDTLGGLTEDKGVHAGDEVVGEADLKAGGRLQLCYRFWSQVDV